MQIRIDGIDLDIEQGVCLADAIEAAGLASASLCDMPLAAMIGGEIFNLNYVPKRECTLRLLRYRDEEGRRVYERTLQFIFIMAVRRLFPQSRVVVQYSLGAGVYISIEKTPALCDGDVMAICGEMRRIAELDLRFERKRMSIADAIDFFMRDGQTDKAKLLRWCRFSYFDAYSCPGYSDYMDYFYGEMAPSSGYARVFGLQRLEDALVLLMPMNANPDRVSEYIESPKLLQVFSQSDAWGKLMRCSTANELNRRVEDGSIRELIRVNEALHEKIYARTADDIIERGVKAVMLAGPSSSGKTTSANRIATQLRADGMDPVMLSLDDYYIDRDKLPKDENGEMDLEHINTLDIPRFNSDLKALLAGEEVEMPIFNFKTGRREAEGRALRLLSDQPLIVEGIHALNPIMLADIRMDEVYRIYVSALTTLNLDDHNRIRTTDLRILRRLVRDYETRGASMERTLSMWGSVRRGEDRWIFPYQEQADRIINTTLHYEVAVMKRYVYPLLLTVEPQSPWYCMARSIVKFLNYFLEADVDNEIPPTSILREFIGGNTFYM